MKEKDRERKKMKAAEMVKIRQEYLKEAEEYWENEMMKKRKQWHANKVLKEVAL